VKEEEQVRSKEFWIGPSSKIASRIHLLRINLSPACSSEAYQASKTEKISTFQDDCCKTGNEVVTTKLFIPFEDTPIVTTFERACDQSYYTLMSSENQDSCSSQLWIATGCTKPFPGKEVIFKAAYYTKDTLDFFKTEFVRLEYSEKFFQQSSICLEATESDHEFRDSLDVSDFFNIPFSSPTLVNTMFGEWIETFPNVNLNIKPLEFSFSSIVNSISNRANVLPHNGVPNHENLIRDNEGTEFITGNDDFVLSNNGFDYIYEADDELLYDEEEDNFAMEKNTEILFMPNNHVANEFDVPEGFG
ncbi:hypothetical protein O9G_006194, partial [Rozella allomycis CSF55]